MRLNCWYCAFLKPTMGWPPGLPAHPWLWLSQPVGVPQGSGVHLSLLNTARAVLGAVRPVAAWHRQQGRRWPAAERSLRHFALDEPLLKLAGAPGKPERLYISRQMAH